MRLDSPVVYLLPQSDYEQPGLNVAVADLLASVIDRGTLRTTRVLLKPNLISARNGRLACTDGRFIAAVARWFLAQGARVRVGDSPAFGSARSVLTAIDALPALRRLDVAVVEFRRRTPTVLPCGQRAALATAALECDLLVNLPKIKAHSQMRLTLAVKNLFGCLAGLHKPWWHMVHGGSNGRFAALLVDLLAVLPPSCTVVDGIVAMHRTGPVHGDPYPLGIVAGGVNPVAIDTGLLSLLQVDPFHCPLWCASHRAGLVGTAVDALVFPRAHPADLAVSGFEVPHELGPIRFDLLRFVTGSIKRLLLRLRGQ